ncbi:NAD(P)-binding protein [Aaosphaeria arxii CBS 175.79]|uniref:NAD(P)-binding protein n=1 Tax=Aaosphaeria arxii CBS 175.79 TaxID=1450172 RepID=A0A6A5XV57_9PLEO|nr:NAD(P)-binding protein [Aaosphaeria arxii CBS 175.79]KAF2016816.1 NAD(P)-binding protein [Aaosphaeria arxii CBS 175.79]
MALNGDAPLESIATPIVSSLQLFSLANKNVFITGGSRGIGAAMAIALAQAGASICLAQSDTTNTATADAVRKLGRKATILKCNLRDMEQVKAIFPQALEVMDNRIDVVVNCGGLLQRKDSVDITEEDWDNILDINLKALFFICQAAGRHMIPRRQGKILNVASLNSFIGGDRVASYAASKGAVSQVTKALSNEWAKYNIQVNALAPGSIATDINTDLRSDPVQYAARVARCPSRRWGAPADFAGPALFLCSDASQYITGEILVVDGGQMAS